jgi:pimeloyl-ACP methyl ester carboxylesterase
MRERFALGLLVVILIVGGCQFAEFSHFAPPPTANEQHFAPTSDHWLLALDRFKPAKLDPRKLPVILCHGLSYNGVFWNLEKGASFAGHLAERGYDVWVPSLRGAGRSKKQPGAPDDWTVDDYIHKDLPAVIEYVKQKTRSPKVTWIGHSMGGMVMCGYLETEKPENVGNFVAIGVPMIMFEPLNDVLRETLKNKNLLAAVTHLTGTKVPAQLVGSLGPRVDVPLYTLFYNWDNIHPVTLMKLKEKVIENISPGVHEQMMRFLQTGEFTSVDGKFSYTKELGRIKTPILFVCGQLDNMAPPDVVRYAYESVSSKHKTYRLFCTANGSRANYGHDDLVLGSYAQIEVFPYIYLWLQKQSGQFNKGCMQCH